MPVFAKDEKHVLFPHVPKTGGSSLERLFTRSGWTVGLRETRRLDGNLMAVRRTSPQHLTADVLRQLFVPARFDLVFMVVRDPVARFRSEYAMRVKDPTRTDAASVEAWAEEVFARLERRPWMRDNHLRPQHDFWLEGAVVYRFEDGLEAVAADLRTRHGLDLPAELPHAMKGARVGGMSSSAVEVSPALEKRLREVYAEDYAQFGYV